MIVSEQETFDTVLLLCASDCESSFTSEWLNWTNNFLWGNLWTFNLKGSGYVSLCINCNTAHIKLCFTWAHLIFHVQSASPPSECLNWVDKILPLGWIKLKVIKWILRHKAVNCKTERRSCRTWGHECSGNINPQTSDINVKQRGHYTSQLFSFFFLWVILLRKAFDSAIMTKRQHYTKCSRIIS